VAAPVEKKRPRAAPMWVRVMAGLAIAAFFVLFAAGLFGYYGWWMVASAVFIVGYGVAWVYQYFNDR
jgi:hypothetical protein